MMGPSLVHLPMATLPRKLIVRTIIGIVSFIFFGFFAPILLSSRINIAKQIQQPAPTAGPAREPLTMLGIDAVRASLDEVRHFRKENNWIIALHCLKQDGGGRCDPSDYHTSTPGFLIVLLDGLAALTHESVYRDEADMLFNDLVSHCSSDTRLCDDAFFALIHRYSDSPNPVLFSFLQSVGQYNLALVPTTVASKILQIEKLVTLHRITGDPAYIALAGSRYEGLENGGDVQDDNPVVATADGDTAIRRYDCGKYWVGFELAQATGNHDLSDTARHFYDSNRQFFPLVGHIGALTMCLEGYESLERATGVSVYRELEKSLIEYGLSNYWDIPVDPKYTGDYGLLLFDYYRSPTNQVLNFKYLNETIWFFTHVLLFPKSLLSI